jgi:tRNA-splicing ligase RtcB
MEIKTINNRIVKIWTDNVEASAMQQIENLTTLPFLFHHLAIMPDVHAGKGMPIGGVLACKDAVVPNAVGVDIGCGMCAVKTNWKVGDIPSDILKNEIINSIRQRIPLGMSHHEEAQDAKYTPQGYDIDKMAVVKTRQNSALHEIGTLGGGNHFIELQKDEEDNL